MKQAQNACHVFFKVRFSDYQNTDKKHCRLAHRTLANEICPPEKHALEVFRTAVKNFISDNS